MEIALIDDDTLYHSVFIDHFSILGVKPVIFKSGEAFMSIDPLDALKFSFLIVDHTLPDMKGIELIAYVRGILISEICLISTEGGCLDSTDLNNFNVSGDFRKTDMNSISSWYKYYKKEKFEYSLGKNYVR